MPTDQQIERFVEYQKTQPTDEIVRASDPVKYIFSTREELELWVYSTDDLSRKARVSLTLDGIKELFGAMQPYPEIRQAFFDLIVSKSRIEEPVIEPVIETVVEPEEVTIPVTMFDEDELKEWVVKLYEQTKTRNYRAKEGEFLTAFMDLLQYPEFSFNKEQQKSRTFELIHYLNTHSDWGKVFGMASVTKKFTRVVLTDFGSA